MIFFAWLLSIAVAFSVGFIFSCALEVKNEPRFRPIGYYERRKFSPPLDTTSDAAADLLRKNFPPLVNEIEGTTKGGDPYRHATIEELTGELMTKRQREVLDFIMAYQVEHSMSPTLREICDQFGLASFATAWEHLANLRHAGYIEWRHNEARSIIVLDSGRQEFVCSKCGATPSRGSR